MILYVETVGTGLFNNVITCVESLCVYTITMFNLILDGPLNVTLTYKAKTSASVLLQTLPQETCPSLYIFPFDIWNKIWVVIRTVPEVSLLFEFASTL